MALNGCPFWKEVGPYQTPKKLKIGKAGMKHGWLHDKRCVDSSQSCPVWNFDHGCFLLLFFFAWFRHFELSLKQILVSLEVGGFSIIFDHSSTDWSSTDPVMLQFLPDALDALRSSGPHWCLAGHAPRRAPSRCGATRASWPSQDHRNVGTNHWQCVIPRIKLHTILDASWMKRMSSSLSRFGWSFQKGFAEGWSWNWEMQRFLSDRDSFQTIFHLRAWRTGCKKDKNGSSKRFDPARGAPNDKSLRVLTNLLSLWDMILGVQGRHLLHLGYTVFPAWWEHEIIQAWYGAGGGKNRILVQCTLIFQTKFVGQEPRNRLDGVEHIPLHVVFDEWGQIQVSLGSKP